jgi:hypothetical protein
VEAHFAFGHGEIHGHVGDEPADDGGDFAAENGMDRAAHAGVAEKRGAAGEDLLVGGLRMGVGAADGGNLAIEKAAHGDFLTGRLGVDIDEDELRFFAHADDFLLDGEEGIFEQRLHEGAALNADDADFSLGGFEDDGALPWSVGGVIERAQKARLGDDVAGGFFLVPDVVAGGDDGDSRAEQIDGNLSRDATASGGVLAVHDHEINVQLFPQSGQHFDDGATAWRAYDVA